ncbi:MAG: hypothetical protein JW727_04950 [Candidatus Aenigmarchaeota archaeon]|nr:hypothetical protein [Candidatus Aenigmarchaeota archaeon]
MTMKINSPLLIALLVLAMPLALCHQPRIVFDREASFENPVIVSQPEISKAYYGQLNGSPEYYRIYSPVSFKLYAGLLSPNISGSRTDFIAEVSNKSRIILILNGPARNWTPYYEEFAGDYYLRGPDSEKVVPSGTYYIRVFNRDNQGKYILAIGKEESFTPDEMARTVFTLPRIKREFFGKPGYEAFFNFTGVFLLIVLSIIAIISYLICKAASKLKKEETCDGELF